jgi:hypothetical protein
MRRPSGSSVFPGFQFWYCLTVWNPFILR